jgi:hypothetical protein
MRGQKKTLPNPLQRRTIQPTGHRSACWCIDSAEALQSYTQHVRQNSWAFVYLTTSHQQLLYHTLHYELKLQAQQPVCVCVSDALSNRQHSAATPHCCTTASARWYMHYHEHCATDRVINNRIFMCYWQKYSFFGQNRLAFLVNVKTLYVDDKTNLPN